MRITAIVNVYLFDGHGNTRMLADENGNITDTYTYDAFGNPINKTGETENNYLYCGEQYDSATGYYYLRARYMNPTSGTFITMDTYQGTVNDPVSLHKYLYAGANPVMNVDPSGNMFFPIVDASVDKIKAAWDKQVLSIAKMLLGKIAFNQTIYTATTFAVSPGFRENILNIVSGKNINPNAKGVFGQGIGASATFLLSAGIQLLYVWDYHLNIGVICTLSFGTGFAGVGFTEDFIVFPTMDNIFQLVDDSGNSSIGGSASVGFKNFSVELEMSNGFTGIGLSGGLGSPDPTIILPFAGKCTYTFFIYKKAGIKE